MKRGQRVIVCGGRDYQNAYRVNAVLSAIHAEMPIYAVIHGNACGADTLAGRWAELNKVREWPQPAQWSRYGRAAGPVRNKHMLGLSPDLVVAFPGGRGTRNMVKQAKSAGVRVMEIAEDKQ